MSIEALNWALKQDVRPAAAKFVLVVLANYANEYGNCDPSQQRLAQLTGMTEKSVRTHLNYLVSKNFIARVERRHSNGKRKRDLYAINRKNLPVDDRKNLPVEDDAADQAETPVKQGKNGIKTRKKQPEKITGNTKDSTKDLYTSEFEEAFGQYPRRDGKKEAAKAYHRAIRAGEVSHETLIAAFKAYADLVDGRERNYIKLPATFINGRHWEDESIVRRIETAVEASKPPVDQYAQVTTPSLVEALKDIEVKVRAQRGTDFWRTWWKGLTFVEWKTGEIRIEASDLVLRFIADNGLLQMVHDMLDKKRPGPKPGPDLRNPYAQASTPSVSPVS